MSTNPYLQGVDLFRRTMENAVEVMERQQRRLKIAPVYDPRKIIVTLSKRQREIE